MNKYKVFGKVFLVSASIVLIAAGCNSTVKPAQDTTPATSTETQKPAVVDSGVISYQGVDGKTALELLKSSHKVETQNFSGVGEFVKTIDGVTPDKDHFWGFYVNGKSSNVGAGDYKSSSTDKIEWKLDAVGDYKE